MSKQATIHLGYEVGSGDPVSVPVQHLAVTGQTQQSGKTTTLEALVSRSGLAAVAFVTKRAEGSFTTGNHIPPYFRERADWQFVSAVLEATLRERLKFERSWIMRACKGARTLGDVHRNVRTAMEKAKGLSADVYMTLDHYLDIVIPQIDRLPYLDKLTLKPGLNVMDLSEYTTELQALVIRSVLEWIYETANDTLAIIPEAWEFIPQKRGSPVLLACETLIRKGGAAKNFVWLDSQDIAGVHKDVLRSVGVWILGVQREANEVKRALNHIPGNVRKPSVDDVMGLERGQFYACYGKVVVKVYVQPAWMDRDDAIEIARGEQPVEAVSAPKHKAKKEGSVNEKEARELREDNERLRNEVRELREQLAGLHRPVAAPAAKPVATQDAPRGSFDPPMAIDALYQEIKRRAAADPGVLALLRERPEIEVRVARQRIEADDKTLYGRVALLITEGFFNEAATGSAAFSELQRRGFKTSKPNVYKECDKLAGQGFLTKESNGFQAVKGMKVNIREAA